MTRKYRNVPIVVDGMRFDSKAEALRWRELTLMEKAGEISDLCRQVPWLLTVNECKIGSYRPDFQYFTKDGRVIVEDVKGIRTPVYRLKAKLMRAIWGIEVTEIQA